MGILNPYPSPNPNPLILALTQSLTRFRAPFPLPSFTRACLFVARLCRSCACPAAAGKAVGAELPWPLLLGVSAFVLGDLTLGSKAKRAPRQHAHERKRRHLRDERRGCCPSI
eukprot:5352061-Pleurochrysis_carterae.AAC.2